MGVRTCCGTSAPQSPGGESMSYSARNTKLLSLILLTRTRSPHSWTWISPRSPRAYSRSLSFRVTSVLFRQACLYMYLRPTTSTIPSPTEQPRSMPSSQALCLGVVSGIFPSFPGVLVVLRGGCALPSVSGGRGFIFLMFALRCESKLGWGSGFG